MVHAGDGICSFMSTELSTVDSRTKMEHIRGLWSLMAHDSDDGGDDDDDDDG